MTNVTLRVLASLAILLLSLLFVSSATAGVWIAIAACWILMAVRIMQADAHHRDVVDNLTKLRRLSKLNFPLGTNLDDL